MIINTTLVPLIEKYNIKLSQQQIDAMILFAFQFGQNSFSEKEGDGYDTMRDFLIKGDYSSNSVKSAYSPYKVYESAESGTISRLNDGIDLFLYGDYNRDYNTDITVDYDKNRAKGYYETRVDN